ncbi:acyl carrier protein [Corallococcus aberystwythensis]|uniref:Acyl carrier protein n=1 Tax=Corallococcus aberystwythensis TaxID=2316722 RepID=A0A3A8Q396_9BACT|nr:acyl carrier protein [Corallococcus aberystwythensis]RKH62548.1 acyl carrier protein [Corallococcus aberystwythensis]
MTKQELFERLSTILQETFDIEPSRIIPEARLHDDLDIDSIDAIDLLVRLKPVAGQRVPPEVFRSVRTLQDVVDALYGLLGSDSAAA